MRTVFGCNRCPVFSPVTDHPSRLDSVYERTPFAADASSSFMPRADDETCEHFRLPVEKNLPAVDDVTVGTTLVPLTNAPLLLRPSYRPALQRGGS